MNIDKMINKIINPSPSVKPPNLIGAKVDMMSDLARSSIFFPFTEPTVKNPRGRVLKGSMPSVRKVMRNFGLKSFGGRNDIDGDGIINKRDCQPRNVMRQDFIYSLRPKGEKHIVPSDLDRDYFVTDDKQLQRSQWGGAMAGRHTGWFGSGIYGFDTLQRAEEVKGRLDEPTIIRKVEVAKPYKPESPHHADILHTASKELYEGTEKTAPLGLGFTAERFTDVLGIPTTKDELLDVKKEARERGVQPINVLMERKGYTGVIPPEEYQDMSYGSVKYQERPMKGWEDNDRDGIINAEDCQPNNPDEQAFWHKKQDKYIPIESREYQTKAKVASEEYLQPYGEVTTVPGKTIGRGVTLTGVAVPGAVPLPLAAAAGRLISSKVENVKLVKTDVHDKPYKIPRLQVHLKQKGKGWEDDDKDGIINAEDCQPNNPDRQGSEDPREILQKITRKGSDVTIKHGISPIILMNTVVANDSVIKRMERVQGIFRDDDWFATWNIEARRALREQGYVDDDIDYYLSERSRALENLATNIMNRMDI